MTLGANIRKARKAKKLSQADLAKLCGWSDGDNGQGRISHYENDRREPTLSDLVLLARATGTTLTALIQGVDQTWAAKFAHELKDLPDEQQKQIFEAFLQMMSLIRSK